MPKEKRKKKNKTSESDDDPMQETNDLLLSQVKDTKYNIIYADPPWNYSISECEGAADNHYATVKTKDLKFMKVEDICAKDCIMFMWTTAPMMKQSIGLLEAWGFKYTTFFAVWVKTTNGEIKGKKMGFSTKQFAEFVIMGTRGSITKFKRLDCPYIPNTFLRDTLDEHSKKPNDVIKMIEAIYEDIPRIELFARATVSPKWDYFGNETDKFGVNKKYDKQRPSTLEVQTKLRDSISGGKLSRKKLIDQGNRFGLDRNRQKSMKDYFM